MCVDKLILSTLQSDLTAIRLFGPDTPYMLHIQFLIRSSMSKSGTGIRRVRVRNTKVLWGGSWRFTCIPLIIGSAWPGWISEREIGGLSKSRDLGGSRHWGGSEGRIAWFPRWLGEPIGFGWLGLTVYQLQTSEKVNWGEDIPVAVVPHVRHGRPSIKLTRVEFLILLLSLIISSASSEGYGSEADLWISNPNLESLTSHRMDPSTVELFISIIRL